MKNLFFWFLGLFGNFEQAMREAFHVNVSLSFNRNIQSHGVIYVALEKGVYPMQLLVDKPEFLVRPNRFVLRQVFAEVERMGFVPVSLTTKFGREANFRVENIDPDMAARNGVLC